MIGIFYLIWEAEAGGSHEPRSWRLQWAEIMPLHSSLGNKSKTPSHKTKQNNNNNKTSTRHIEDKQQIIEANASIAVITLIVNELNFLIKTEIGRTDKHEQFSYLLYKRLVLDTCKNTNRLKVKRWKNIFQANSNQESRTGYINIRQNRLYTKFARDKEGHYIRGSPGCSDSCL